MSKTDPRTVRSHQMLVDALIDCMETKNAAAISVCELTEKAGLNRTTFYLHFQDMPDFFDKIIGKTVNGLIDAANTGKGDGKRGDFLPDSYYVNYFLYIKKNKRLFQAMLGENGLPVFRERLVDMGIQAYTQLLGPYRAELEKHIELDILVCYIISAHTGLIDYWLRTDCKYSAEYMAAQVRYLTIESLGPVAALREKLNLPL